MRQLDLASLLFQHIASVSLCPCMCSRMHTVEVGSQPWLIYPQSINIHVSGLLDQHDTNLGLIFLYSHSGNGAKTYLTSSAPLEPSAQEPQPACARTSCTAILTRYQNDGYSRYKKGFFSASENFTQGFLFPSYEIDPSLLNDCSRSVNSGGQQHLNSILSV